MNFSSAVRYINKAPSVRAEGDDRATPSLLRFSLLMRMLGDPHKQIESVTVLGELGRSGASSAVAAMRAMLSDLLQALRELRWFSQAWAI